ncbi:MAG: periplasmic heavy metal sensor [Candidatus Accumulibacter sp.]|jgi:Spy/CpxP family protein refolding chaperone|nr:periplasmic heavy metal sensor [Accumulibacter sp.]
MQKFATPRTLAAIIAVSLGLAAGSSFASPGRHGDGPHGMRMDAAHAHAHALAPMFHGRALARLHDELKLDAQQEALWKEAGDFTREQREAMRERMTKNRAEIRTLLDQPGSDLRAVVKRLDEQRADTPELRNAIRERWFAVYDALDAEQKEKVRLFFKDGAERKTEAWTKRGKDGHRRGAKPAQN